MVSRSKRAMASPPGRSSQRGRTTFRPISEPSSTSADRIGGRLQSWRTMRTISPTVMRRARGPAGSRPRAALAGQDVVVHQLLQDLLQIAPRDALAPGDVDRAHRARRRRDRRCRPRPRWRTAAFLDSLSMAVLLRSSRLDAAAEPLRRQGRWSRSRRRRARCRPGLGHFAARRSAGTWVAITSWAMRLPRDTVKGSGPG